MPNTLHRQHRRARLADSIHHDERRENPQNGRIRLVEKYGRSRRQTGAALGATRLQYGATSPGLHPFTKSMLFCTTTLAGLKCTFHASLLTSLSRRLEATTFRLGQWVNAHNAETSEIETLQWDLSFCPLWKTCYVSSPRSSDEERHTAVKSYIDGILHIMWCSCGQRKSRP